MNIPIRALVNVTPCEPVEMIKSNINVLMSHNMMPLIFTIDQTANQALLSLAQANRNWLRTS